MDVVATKKRPRKECATVAQKAGKKPWKKTKCTSSQDAEHSECGGGLTQSEDVVQELERERAIRAKIQEMLNNAYKRLSQLDPNFEPPELHLVHPNAEALQSDLNGDETHQIH